VRRYSRASKVSASESPIAIELIDTVEKIEAFVAEVEQWIGAAMITFEDIDVVYRAAKAP
jgi:PII-like signaling protein